MKLTIIAVDGSVYVDGVSFSGLNLANVPADVHALQWDNNSGWIEFKVDNGHHPANQNITELPDWAISAKSKWDEAKTASEAPVQITANQVQPTTIGTQSA